LQSENFSFPATRIYGNPTTRKPYDEGYFVFDSKNALYHIKRIKNQPFCKKVNVPENMKIKTIFLREFSLKEFYAFVISEDNKLYLLLFDNYKIQEIPIKDYNSEKDILRFQGDIFYRTIVVYKENKLNVYVTDRDYNLVNTYEQKWLSNKERTAGIASAYIFPFELSVKSADSEYIDFYFSEYSFTALYLSFILIIFTIILMRRKIRNLDWNNFIPDFLIILITGIFGFIAVNVFRFED
jgi:hypothetical protein